MKKLFITMLFFSLTSNATTTINVISFCGEEESILFTETGDEEIQICGSILDIAYLEEGKTSILTAFFLDSGVRKEFLLTSSTPNRLTIREKNIFLD